MSARRPRIVCPPQIPTASRERLRLLGDVHLSSADPDPSQADLAELVQDADAIMTMLDTRVDGALLGAAGPSLRIVANVAAGYDNFDLAAFARAGVVGTNTPGVLVDATADLTIALLLATTRRIVEGHAIVASGGEWRWELDFLLGTGLQGKRMGIVGMGEIGSAVARRAASFGLEVVHHSRREVADPCSRAVGFDELIETSDIVSLHCPLTSDTRHLIDAGVLSRMKSTACLINTARGAIIDEDALVAALRTGAIACAGLDVYEDEPRVHEGLRELPHVVLLPHLGSATIETRRAMADLAVDNVVTVLRGGAPLTPIREMPRA